MSSKIIDSKTAAEEVHLLEDKDLSGYDAERANLKTVSVVAPITIYIKRDDATKKKYTSLYYKKLLNTAFDLPGEKISEKVEFDCFSTTIQTRVGTLDSMENLAKRVIKKGGTITFFKGEAFILCKVISYMFAIPGFKDAYEQYYLSPDDGVSGEGEEKMGSTEFEYSLAGFGLDEEPIAGEKTTAYTRAEFECIAFVLILFMNKKVINEVQYKAVIEKRVAAFCISCGLSSIVVSSFTQKFEKKQLMELADRMSFYPKLKVQIHLAILNARSAMSSHIKTILRDTQLTIFNFIHMFLTSPKKTKLHIVHIVLRETRTWLEVYRKLVDMYGDHWRYYKLLEPTSTLTSLVDIPHLACAALSFVAVHYDPSHTASKIVGKVQPNNLYKTYASQLMPESMLKQEQVASKVDFKSIEDSFTDAGLEMGYSLKDAINYKDWESIETESQILKNILGK